MACFRRRFCRSRQRTLGFRDSVVHAWCDTWQVPDLESLWCMRSSSCLFLSMDLALQVHCIARAKVFSRSRLGAGIAAFLFKMATWIHQLAARRLEDISVSCQSGRIHARYDKNDWVGKGIQNASAPTHADGGLIFAKMSKMRVGVSRAKMWDHFT